MSMHCKMILDSLPTGTTTIDIYTVCEAASPDTAIHVGPVRFSQSKKRFTTTVQIDAPDISEGMKVITILWERYTTNKKG